MKGKPPVAAELNWPQVHAFRLQRHHLTKRAPKRDLVRVVGEIGGAQAQLMSAAEMQIAVRVDCTADDVRAALWKDRKLAKTWLMRGTLHLVPAADLPIYTAAMNRMSVRNLKAWLKFLKVSEKEFDSLIDAIGDAMSGKPMTREELIQAAGKGRSERIREIMKSGWGGVLKPVARRGLLCFGPSRGQSVTFVRPDQWLTSWRELDPDEAITEVARRYLRVYGPATKNDFARWWGNWAGVGIAAWAGLAGELVSVSVEGERLDLLAPDLERMEVAPDGPSVQLLPGFDPYLMGHASRAHLVESVHVPKVSRTAGWISAVVLVGGRVAGTWSHVVAKQTLRITIEPFRRLPTGTLPELRARAASLARALGLADAELKVVS